MLLRHVVLDKLKIPNRELHPPFCWQRSIGEVLWYNEQFAIHMLRGTSDKSWLRLVAMGSSTSQVIRQIDTVQKEKKKRERRGFEDEQEEFWQPKDVRASKLINFVLKWYLKMISKEENRFDQIQPFHCWESKLFKLGIFEKSWWIWLLTGSNKA